MLPKEFECSCEEEDIEPEYCEDCGECANCNCTCEEDEDEGE